MKPRQNVPLFKKKILTLTYYLILWNGSVSGFVSDPSTWRITRYSSRGCHLGSSQQACCSYRSFVISNTHMPSIQKPAPTRNGWPRTSSVEALCLPLISFCISRWVCVQDGQCSCLGGMYKVTQCQCITVMLCGYYEVVVNKHIETCHGDVRCYT